VAFPSASRPSLLSLVPSPLELLWALTLVAMLLRSAFFGEEEDCKWEDFFKLFDEFILSYAVS
jgi:hypothetical protein